MKPALRLAALVLAFAAFAAFPAGCQKETAETAAPKLAAAVEANDTAAAKALLADHPGLSKTAKNANGVPALRLAVQRGNADLVGPLLDDGADPNGTDGGWTALLQAAIGPPAYPAVVKLLLDHGADPDARTSRGDTPLMASRGVTPLMVAAQVGNKEIVDALVAKKADVNARVNGGGPSVLHYAVTGGNADIVDALIRKGAKVDVKDADGLTPLQLAQSAAAPAKTPEEEDAEIKALAQKDPAAAAQLAAERIVKRNTINPLAGKDMTKVIEVLKKAGAT